VRSAAKTLGRISPLGWCELALLGFWAVVLAVVLKLVF